MALPKNFPKSPYAILDPDFRWLPDDKELHEQSYQKLLPPLVDKLRREVSKWRDKDYKGVSATSRALLKWWFQTEHPQETTEGIEDFQYYFAQREAVETIIYCYEVAQVKDKYDLIRYDSSGGVSAGMFPEDWLRLVIKMATGTGKTKVMSLLVAWSYFHKLYEEDSTLARNFLLITPNIIVFDRIRDDFEGLKIFGEDPVLPRNGYEGQHWQDDFQMSIFMQDNVNAVRKTGNIFLTNIHRVYNSKGKIYGIDDDREDYFLGDKPVAKTSDSKIDLGEIVRDLDELLIINDEAHHIHDERLEWFKSIQDISNNLKLNHSSLSLQVDVTATPKHTNGSIFVQTISDYPLVEAIHQDVVKHPVLPDAASRAKLQEYKSLRFTEKYKDYIHLGYVEWKKIFARHQKLTKKAVLFIMTDDTRNCDDVAEYLSKTYKEFEDEKSILVIHTKNNGEISEAVTGKKEKELAELREAANEIDAWDSPYKAIVSVLMLKEGWDTRNVTTIVGLRAYAAKSNILPEQTLGRGLRRMYKDPDIAEYVSVVGTDPFMEFVESIRSEGIKLERVSMGRDAEPRGPLIIEVERGNRAKDIEKLDIEIPVLTPRIYREYKNLVALSVGKFRHKRIALRKFSKEEKKQIVFRDIASGEVGHRTYFDSNFVPDYQNVIGYFARTINKELKRFGGYDVLYGKVKEFVMHHLFDQNADLEDANTLRNLAEQKASKTVIETFKEEINKMTVVDKDETEIRHYKKVSQTRPFVMRENEFLLSHKSVFNRIVGDSHFELEFASFLERCDDIVSYAKNYLAVRFIIDYQSADGNIRDYLPDFLVKVSNRKIYIIETKGREDLDDLAKKRRLYQWCEDVNAIQSKVKFAALYVKQEDFNKYNPKNFRQLVRGFGGD